MYSELLIPASSSQVRSALSLLLIFSTVVPTDLSLGDRQYPSFVKQTDSIQDEDSPQEPTDKEVSLYLLLNPELVPSSTGSSVTAPSTIPALSPRLNSLSNASPRQGVLNHCADAIQSRFDSPALDSDEEESAHNATPAVDQPPPLPVVKVSQPARRATKNTVEKKAPAPKNSTPTVSARRKTTKATSLNDSDSIPAESAGTNGKRKRGRGDDEEVSSSTITKKARMEQRSSHPGDNPDKAVTGPIVTTTASSSNAKAEPRAGTSMNGGNGAAPTGGSTSSAKGGNAKKKATRVANRASSRQPRRNGKTADPHPIETKFSGWATLQILPDQAPLKKEKTAEDTSSSSGAEKPPKPLKLTYYPVGMSSRTGAYIPGYTVPKPA